MVVYTGKAVCSGIAIGKIKLFQKSDNIILNSKVTDAEAEIIRFEAAKDVAIGQLNALCKETSGKVDSECAEIFSAQTMLLLDEKYTASVYGIIKDENAKAEYAVHKAGRQLADELRNIDDECISAKSDDIMDITKRIINVLMGNTERESLSYDDAVIVSDELLPGDIVRMDTEKLKALVLKKCSTYSHTSILARAMGIPVLSGILVSDEYNGEVCIVDGGSGEMIVNPDDAMLDKYNKKMASDETDKDASLKGYKTVTKSEKKTELLANAGSVADIARILESDAEGIGLFRSEYLYLESDSSPSEEYQFSVYKRIAEAMAGKRVIIRTLDTGADKSVDYLGLEKEENPALGLRGIRISLKHPEILRTQLRAILRASAYGNIDIMYPMITSVDDVLKVKALFQSVREELVKEGISVGDVAEGIMIETPAAAIMSDELAKHADFFSIGTNDLTQFVMAADRQNEELSHYYDINNPAVKRLIKMTVDNAHSQGIPASVCGELLDDNSLIKWLADIGVDRFSVSVESIDHVKSIICQ